MVRIGYKWLILILIFTATFINTTYASANEITAEEEIKAKFIVNYIHYTKWPANIRKKSDVVTVCVIEGDLTALYLRKANDNPSNKVTLKVKEKGKKANFTDCNILYISKIYENDEDYLINITKGKPILTISDIPGFSENGGITGFILTPGKDVELILNMKALMAANIDIDPDLLLIMKILK
jgi:hypothetical protein